MTRFATLVVWFGGVLFVTSLIVFAYTYVVVWSTPGATAVSWPNVAVDAVVFSAFAAHHSFFARERAKVVIARYVPELLLRSFYVWTASLLFVAVLVGWRRVGGEIYHVTGQRAIAHAGVQLFGLWLIIRAVTVIDPFELAGIRRAGKAEALQVVGPYHWVRHPLYLGWMLALFGVANMTGDRLTFAAISSIYLVVAIRWEERSLTRAFGGDYDAYKQQVRWRVVPYVF